MRLARTLAAIALASFASAAFARRARADTRVVVVDDGDRATRAATERLRGELAAAGFTVVPRSARPGDARDDVEAAPDDSVASIRLARTGTRGVTELWVSDRLTGKTLVRRVDADPERSPRLVALRGVELLRASLLELESPPHDDAPPATPALAQPPPPEIAHFVAPAAPPPPAAEKPAPRSPPARWIEHAAIDAGIAVLASTDHLGPAATPKLGAWLALPASFALRLELVGPAFQSGITSAAGSAVVRQELGTIDLAWAPLLARVVAPFVAVGGGPYHLHVEGTASLPGYQGASNDVWAGLFAASVGVGFRIAQGVSLAAEGRAFFVTPRPEVTIGGQSVATAETSLLGSASLIASF